HSGTLSYRDVSGLSVGTVTDTALTSPATSGITDNADVRLTTGGGLTSETHVSPRISGDLPMNATGTVTQTAEISATGLQLLGSGAVNLDLSAIPARSSADSHSGTLSYRDVSGLAVGTVTDTALTSPATSGITDNADVRLTTGGG